MEFYIHKCHKDVEHVREQAFFEGMLAMSLVLLAVGLIFLGIRSLMRDLCQTKTSS